MEKNRVLRRDFKPIIIDSAVNYRPELESIGILGESKEGKKEDFSFATSDYLDNSRTVAEMEIKKYIDTNVENFHKEYDNVIFKKSLENICLFVMK